MKGHSNDKYNDYAESIVKSLRNKGIRIEADYRAEKIGYKIREAQLEKVPYMLVIGDKEVEANTVSVRSRKEGDIGAIKVEEFISKIKYEIENYVK